MSKSEEMSTAASIEGALGMIRRSVYLRVAAVQHAESLEEDRTSLSPDPEGRARQKNYLWAKASNGLCRHGVSYEPRTLSGRVMVPYRRFEFAWTEFPATRKVLEVLARVRPHLLEAVSALYFSGHAAEGSVGGQLVEALAGYDLPAIARLADEHEPIRSGLGDYLGFDADDFASMSEVDSPRWGRLGVANEDYGRFDPDRWSAR